MCDVDLEVVVVIFNCGWCVVIFVGVGVLGVYW